jgi:hypothetical protein
MASQAASAYHLSMSHFPLKLFKHPNAPGNGLPVDTFVIEAPNYLAARGKALAIIADAPAVALEKPKDVFVLEDANGVELERWDHTNA